MMMKEEKRFVPKKDAAETQRLSRVNGWGGNTDDDDNNKTDDYVR